MENNKKLIEWKGGTFGVFAFLVTLLFCFQFETNTFYSFLTATLASGLIWGSYIVMRMIFLATRKED